MFPVLIFLKCWYGSRLCHHCCGVSRSLGTSSSRLFVNHLVFIGPVWWRDGKRSNKSVFSGLLVFVHTLPMLVFRLNERKDKNQRQNKRLFNPIELVSITRFIPEKEKWKKKLSVCTSMTPLTKKNNGEHQKQAVFSFIRPHDHKEYESKIENRSRPLVLFS